MLVYRICWPQFTDDLTGQGSFLFGGRWNFKGERMLYTATNPSLAMLEMLVHLPNCVIQTNFCLITIELKFKTIDELELKDCPQDWRNSDAPESLKRLGSSFLKMQKHAGLLVPSVIMPKDKNLLINPLHKDTASLTIVDKMDLEIEKRLLAKV